MARNNITTVNQGPRRGNWAGPIKSAEGAYYCVLNRAGFPPRVHKADDPLNGTWSETDTAGEPTNALPGHVWIEVTGSEILVVTMDVADGQLRFHVFNTSSDTWTTVDTMINDVTGNNDNPDINLKSVGIYVQTDGDYVVVGSDAREGVKGTRYNRISFWRSTTGGSSWTGPNAIDDGGEVHYGGVCLHGVGNRVHVIYGSGDNVDASNVIAGNHKTIRDADTLSTAVGLANGAGNLYTNCGHGVDYDDGGTQRVRMPWRVVTTNITEIVEFDDGDSPSITENTGASSNAVGHNDLANSLKRVFLMTIDNSGLDIYSDENDDDRGWGTDVLEETTTNAQFIYCNVYLRETEVLAWIDEESDQFWYNEKNISGQPFVHNVLKRRRISPIIRL